MGKLSFPFDGFDISIETKNELIYSIELTNDGKYNDKEPLLLECKKQIIEYLQGKRKIFDLPLQKDQGSFRESVYDVILKVPYGEKISYGEVAKRLGDKNKARAVGNALNRNMIPIIIPCHRVIAANDKIGGYNGGIQIKKRLLSIEENNS